MAKRKAAVAETPPLTETAPPKAEARDGYTVLARRYRPQLFDELVGQEPVAQALVNALRSGRIAHAYLFTGARGVGKTSAARILAKCLNCVNGPTPNPCNQCDSCIAVAQGEDVDVIEIDGASNNKVEEVREIRSNVQYRPSRGRYKIYIIDEVHMLSTSAFNALLKTLEEPPAHVKFIFATTEVQKIPVTILSRCQRFDFAGIGTPRIVKRLQQIVAAEKMQADDEALEVIARRAGGSMRDAQSLLDQLLAFGSERVTLEQVQRLLGMASNERVTSLAAAVLDKNAAAALAMVAAAADDGMQVGEFIDQLIAYWRDLMIANCAGTDGQTLNVPSSHKEALLKQAEQLPLDTILAGLDILTSAKARIRGSSHPRMVVEMALVRLARLDDLVPLSQLAQSIAQGTVTPATSGASSQPARGTGLAGRFQGPQEEGKKNVSLMSEPSITTPITRLTPENMSEGWEKVLGQVGMTLGMALRRAKIPAISGPNSLAICFPTAYNHERSLCQDAVSLARIEEILRSLTGQPWSIRIETEADDASQGPESIRAASESAQARNRRARSEALGLPLLKRAIEALDAQVMDVPEGFGAAVGAGQTDRQEQQET